LFVLPAVRATVCAAAETGMTALIIDKDPLPAGQDVQRNNYLLAQQGRIS
jgi:hypothetical protein